MTTDGNDVHQVTNGPSDYEPAWSPDGKTIAFVRDVGGVQQIFLLDIVTGTVEQLTHDPTDSCQPAW